MFHIMSYDVAIIFAPGALSTYHPSILATCLCLPALAHLFCHPSILPLAHLSSIHTSTWPFFYLFSPGLGIIVVLVIITSTRIPPSELKKEKNSQVNCKTMMHGRHGRTNNGIGMLLHYASGRCRRFLFYIDN